MMKANTIDERKELVQDIIDRLLYLPELERTAFLNGMAALLSQYNTKVQNVNGLRIVPSNVIN
jgi:hypothetical protein